LAQIYTQLPPAIAAAAQTRGKSGELWMTASTWLAELRGRDWAATGLHQ
jgi:hypothetical protein